MSDSVHGYCSMGYCLYFGHIGRLSLTGIWHWTDAWIFPNDPLVSYWFTSVVGAVVAFGLCCGNSLLAPPAIFLLDGPDTDAPPIAVTALGSHFSVTLPLGEPRPRLPIYIGLLDLVCSFGMIPFAVVWFWRGRP
jgi:hypothetical protein